MTYNSEIIADLLLSKNWQSKAKSDIKIGDLVLITGILPNDPDPLDIGDVGVVTDIVSVLGIKQMQVSWLSNRTLCILESDPFFVYENQEIKSVVNNDFIVEY